MQRDYFGESNTGSACVHTVKQGEVQPCVRGDGLEVGCVSAQIDTVEQSGYTEASSRVTY